MPLVPDRFTYYSLTGIYILSAMGAYQIGSIPFQWLGSILAVFVVFVILYQGKTYDSFYFYPLIFALLIIFFSMLGWWSWSMYIDFSRMQPPGASTDYYLFIILRYVQYIAFFGVYFICVSFLKANGMLRLANMVVLIGVVVSVYAVYVYIAQLYELYEIPRNRIGTGGEEQSVTFSYAFHRAMGSFREPSHLAQWLLLPFFMTFIGRSKWYLAARILIVFVVFLTGSLTGILAMLVGYSTAMLLVFPWRKALFSAVAFTIVLLIAERLFVLFAMPNEAGSTEIYNVLIDRLIPILQNGLEVSNRGHIYEYVYRHGLPIIGYGFGNGNLLIGEYLGLGLMGSFLSLYLNLFYSIGLIGFVFAFIFLVVPVFMLLRLRVADRRHLLVLLGSYVAWLLIFSALTEELSISFAIIYAACIHYSRNIYRVTVREKSSVSLAV